VSANPAAVFTDLQREVALLQRCSHAHLLPLLGHCLERTAPCLLFPLCVGGSLQARLQPSRPDHWTSLQRLGFSAVPPPLSWRQRLSIVREACEALTYLHVPTAAKPRIVHRDVKPANILLDANLHARLADTGFAKATLRGDERLTLSGQGACYTPGFADPIVINGGEYSAITDGYAVGMTLLVCLTNRSPIALIDRCEAEFGRDWDEIAGHEVASSCTTWPAAVADAVKELAAGGRGTSLCADRRRKRSSIEQTMHTLQELLGRPGCSPAELQHRAVAAREPDAPPPHGERTHAISHSVESVAIVR
jgi:serine/threonine protein kinase